MKTSRSLIRNLGAVSIVLITLSGCAASQNDSVQKAQYGAPLQPLGERVQLEGLRFRPDSPKMRSDSKPILDAAAELLKSEPHTKVYVDAYCDRLGTERADRRLAKRRAESVKSSLEARGIPPERMIPRGFASEHSVSPSRSSQIFNRNSKVELIPFTSAQAPTYFASSLSETSKSD
jgi:outer membrane protein OmpA-like peptidoglycan-associated protein